MIPVYWREMAELEDHARVGLKIELQTPMGLVVLAQCKLDVNDNPFCDVLKVYGEGHLGEVFQEPLDLTQFDNWRFRLEISDLGLGKNSQK